MDRTRALTLSCAGLVVLAIVALGRTPGAPAGLRVPSDPGEVLERLPSGPREPRIRELQRRRKALVREPGSLPRAIELARLEIEAARELGDPRHLGRAQAALAPWWDAPDSPAEVLVLRATIEQSLHEFDAALRTLDRALALAPDAPQAWLTRSVVLTVRGRYDEARASCDALARVSPSALAVVVCREAIASVTGDARGAYDRLAAAALAGGVSAGEEAWALSSMGEAAERAGRAREAEAAYRRVLERDPGDAYTRAALADLLLDEGRGAEAAALVAGREDNDALLLRLALAEKQAGSPFAAHDAELAERFAASAARGDVVHRREEARFWLGLRGDAARALALAKANWQVQREPWDARIFLEAAAASADGRREAEPVLAWLASTRLEHPAVERAAATLKERP